MTTTRQPTPLGKSIARRPARAAIAVDDWQEPRGRRNRCRPPPGRRRRNRCPLQSGCAGQGEEQCDQHHHGASRATVHGTERALPPEPPAARRQSPAARPNDSIGADVARSAGASPKASSSRAVAAVNPRIRQSKAMHGQWIAAGAQERNQRGADYSRQADPQQGADDTADSRLSDSNWRTMRPRDAPVARRTAITRAGARPRQQQVRQIGARHEQDQRGQPQEAPERRLVPRAQRRETASSRNFRYARSVPDPGAATPSLGTGPEIVCRWAFTRSTDQPGRRRPIVENHQVKLSSSMLAAAQRPRRRLRQGRATSKLRPPTSTRSCGRDAHDVERMMLQPERPPDDTGICRRTRAAINAWLMTAALELQPRWSSAVARRRPAGRRHAEHLEEVAADEGSLRVSDPLAA